MRNRNLALAAAVLLLSFGASASGASNWPTFHGDPARTGSSSDSIRVPLSLLWSVSSGGQSIVASPVVADGVLYVGTYETSSDGSQPTGRLIAMGADTGTIYWVFPGPQDQVSPIGAIQAAPTVVPGSIVFSSLDGWIYCLTPEGKLRWRYYTGGTAASSPLVLAGRVIVTSGFPNLGEVIGLSLATGQLIWDTKGKLASGTGQEQYLMGTLAAVGNSAVVLSRTGAVYSLDPADGHVLWSQQGAGGASLLAPAVSNGRVYTVADAFSRVVQALPVDGGKPVWQWQYAEQPGMQTVSSPATNGKLLVFGAGSPRQSVYALDAATGKPLWSTEVGVSIGAYGCSSSPAIAGDVVLVGAADSADAGGRLVVLDAATGKELQTDDALRTERPIIASPAVAGGRVFVADTGGTVKAFANTIPYGDPYSDGRIDIKDVMLAFRAALGLEKLTPDQLAAADVEPVRGATVGDGVINISDVMSLLRRSLGLTPPTWP